MWLVTQVVSNTIETNQLASLSLHANPESIFISCKELGQKNREDCTCTVLLFDTYRCTCLLVSLYMYIEASDAHPWVLRGFILQINTRGGGGVFPRHGSLFSRNPLSVIQPPPTRTITVLLRKRTRNIFPFSPNWKHATVIAGTRDARKTKTYSYHLVFIISFTLCL